MTDLQHHPIFGAFERWCGRIPERFEANFLGVMTRSEFCTIDGNFATALPAENAEPPLPRFDEEYFEWVDVLEAVAGATRTFVMVELGAGWGRWLMNGAAAARRRGLDFLLVGVEAEPTHFRWMTEHFGDNGVSGSALRLEEAAVAGEAGWVNFHVGDPAAWYGQAIDPGAARAKRPSRLRRFVARRRGDRRAVIPVRAVTLAQLLEPLDHVDLIDLDVQGAEADVLEAAAVALDEKVKRVHIGTHSTDNETRLRALFGKLGWASCNDYPFASESETPYGRITFQDGVQTWINPRRDHD